MFLSEKYDLVRDLARGFAEKELTREILDETEETEVFPKAIQDKMAKAGFYGITSPKEFGGQGGDYLAYCIVMEEISRKSPVASLYISSPNSLAGGPIVLSGTEEQKEKYLRPVVTGQSVLCFALTEPGAGSDAGSVSSTAVRDNDHYILNGRKTFITMAPFSDFAIVYAKTDTFKGTRGISAFIVDMKSEGVSCGKPENKMGLIGCATSDIILTNVWVHESDRLGEEGAGFINAMKTLDVGRMGVAAQSLGVAQACLDETISYTKQRKQFGQPISGFQNTQFMIADMAAKIEAARCLVYEAAKTKMRASAGDKMANSTLASSIAKYAASEICNEVAGKAVQLHGGYGYIREYKVERLYRDCRVFTIYEGTSQVQQMVIAAQLLK
jgi:alkylation response protein AidB-like acyl-CoA dehydrogenase